MSQKMKIFSIFILSVLNTNLISCKKANNAPFPEPYATNINTFNAKSIKTATPLAFRVNPIQASKVYNTGSSLFFSTMEGEKTQLSGGILNDTYNFFQNEFFWDLDFKSDVGNRINGIGSPVQVVITLYNTKYGDMKTAATKNDGVVQFVLFVYVSMVQSIKQADTSVIFGEYFSYNWYYTPSFTQDYYFLPGTYTDIKSSVKYNNPTVIYLIRIPSPFISYEQFNSTFGSLRNQAGQPFSNKIKFVPGNSKSLKHGSGLLLLYK